MTIWRRWPAQGLSRREPFPRRRFGGEARHDGGDRTLIDQLCVVTEGQDQREAAMAGDSACQPNPICQETVTSPADRSRCCRKTSCTLGGWVSADPFLPWIGSSDPVSLIHCSLLRSNHHRPAPRPMTGYSWPAGDLVSPLPMQERASSLTFQCPTNRGRETAATSFRIEGRKKTKCPLKRHAAVVRSCR